MLPSPRQPHVSQPLPPSRPRAAAAVPRPAQQPQPDEPRGQDADERAATIHHRQAADSGTVARTTVSPTATIATTEAHTTRDCLAAGCLTAIRKRP